MIWNDPSIMIKRKKNHEVKMAQYIGLVVDVIVVGFVRFCYFFFPTCLSTTPLSYLRVQALSQQRI